MTMHRRAPAFAAVLLAFAFAATPRPARADIQDYEFRLVAAEVKIGEVVLTVRLVNRKTGESVPDAVIFAHRLDMAPDGMATMTSPVEPMPSETPGHYRFKTSLAMAGGWRLSLAAKVQGETGTLAGRLVVRAAP